MRAMRYLAAFALMVALFATTTLAQRRGTRGQTAGTRGFTGHPSFSGHIGPSAPGGNWRPAAPFGHSNFVGRGSERLSRPQTTGFRPPYRRFGFAPNWPADRSSFAARSHGWDHDHHRQRGRGTYFAGRLGYGFPGWLGYPYPYLLDPGFFDWGDSQDSAYDQGGSVPPYANQPPYTSQGSAPEMSDQSYPAYTPSQPPPAPQSAENRSGLSLVPALERPLTVIFNDGHAPQKMENYMLTARILTDLDAEHYQEIPLDQIDVAATEQANRSNGVDFQVPSARN